ncbi:MAG TPA: hypothetical protein PKI19_13680 [Elusimicrobiales bacterium]|nr:hypothetical protein [Elusimicrobiales bacterium]
MTFSRFVFYCFLLLTAAYAALTYHPDALFTNVYSYGSITLRSRAPLNESARAMVSRINEKVSGGDFSAPGQKFEVYFPASGYLYALLTPFCGKSFSCLQTVTGKIFVASADFEKNLAADPGGAEEPRLLENVITHEIIKAQVKNKVGGLTYLLLPEMKKEGYAEHMTLETAELQPAEICKPNAKRATLLRYLAQRLELELLQFESDATYPSILKTEKADETAMKRLRQKYCN